jgi:hypothetical protein
MQEGKAVCGDVSQNETIHDLDHYEKCNDGCTNKSILTLSEPLPGSRSSFPDGQRTVRDLLFDDVQLFGEHLVSDRPRDSLQSQAFLQQSSDLGKSS